MNVVSLFDESGNALRPWAEAGFHCYAFDIENKNNREDFPSDGFIYYANADLFDTIWISRIIELKPVFVMGFPPCTDLAVSGAKHFARKLAADPECQRRATRLARLVELIGEECGVPWFAENPVSVLATLWRKPDCYWHPYEFGGYLPENDIHPRWPEYILPRDAYEKLTCFWTGNGYELPEKKPVSFISVRYENGVKGSVQFAKLGGKSKKTKQIRSETPRGLALANFVKYGIPLLDKSRVSA